MVLTSTEAGFHVGFSEIDVFACCFGVWKNSVVFRSINFQLTYLHANQQSKLLGANSRGDSAKV